MSDNETVSPSTSAQGEARESDAELAASLLLVAADSPIITNRERAAICRLAAHRLEAKAEISEAMVERAAKATWDHVQAEMTDPAIPWDDVANGVKERIRIRTRAALEAALSGKEE